MKTVILAPGPSMSQELAHSLQEHHTVVVNDTYKIAPWADALAAQDREWWDNHKDTRAFAGRKFSSNYITGIERICDPWVANSSNSGVLALQVAKFLGATTIELYGFDMHGTHYFGAHPAPLNNTTQAHYTIFQNQFVLWRNANPDVHVVNKTPNSALEAFPHE